MVTEYVGNNYKIYQSTENISKSTFEDLDKLKNDIEKKKILTKKKQMTITPFVGGAYYVLSTVFFCALSF